MATVEELELLVRELQGMIGGDGSWPIPALLNGWVNYNSFAVRYFAGSLQFRGEIFPGTLASNTPICQLPMSVPERVYLQVPAWDTAASVGQFLIAGDELRVSDVGPAASLHYNFGGVQVAVDPS